MQIKNHWLVDVHREPTKKYSKGRTIDPKFIVYHYTAGWSFEGDLNTLAHSSKQVSCQLLIDRNGHTVQMGGFNRRMWHAGPSRSHGYTDLNSHSVGIEICNIGNLRPMGNGQYKWYTGKIVDGTKPLPNGIGGGVPPEQWEHLTHSVVGSGVFAWEPYSDAVLEKLDDISVALRDTYGIKYAVSHEEIDTRGWKSDPGPVFPMKRYESIVDNRQDPTPVVSEDEPSEWINVINLNVRNSPEWDGDVSHVLPRFTEVEVIDQHKEWLLIAYLDSQMNYVGGWVYGKYMERN